jgi:NMD protein affecting ribosome stability and mRNA decay
MPMIKQYCKECGKELAHNEASICKDCLTGEVR